MVGFHFQIFQKKKKNKKRRICLLQNLQKGSQRSNSDHTSPFEGFWFPKAGPLMRYKHMASIFLSISTTPLPMKVDFFLLVFPYFVARGVIISLSLSLNVL
jgi:hypothetical protein